MSVDSGGLFVTSYSKMASSTQQPPLNVTQIRRPKIRRAWSAPSHRQPPPNQQLKVSGFRLHRDIESEFQSELGKSLFEKTVELHETTELKVLNHHRSGTPEPVSEKEYCCRRKCDVTPYFYDKRRCVNIRATQCRSPLVSDDKNFTTYFRKGRLDNLTVATSRGAVDRPVPNIGKCVQRIKSANVQSVQRFSLKDLYFDESFEDKRGSYWISKVREREEERRLKTIENFCREILEELFQGPVSDEMFYKDKEKHLINVKKALDEQTQHWFNQMKEEAKRDAEEREAERKRLQEEAKKSKRKKSKKKRPKSILKSRLRSKSDTDSDGASLKSLKGDKTVRFREKLTDTRIIRPKSSVKRRSRKSQSGDDDSSDTQSSVSTNSRPDKKSASGGRILSPKRKSGKKKKTFPGYISSEKVTKKKKKKSKVEPSPLEVNQTEEPSKVVEVTEEVKGQELSAEVLVTEPEVIILDEPPNFSLAEDYRTKKEMVADWLQNKFCTAAPKTLPLI